MTSVYPIEADTDRRALWATLGIGFVLSVGLHLGAGIGVSAYFSRVNQTDGADEQAIDILPDPTKPMPDQNELKLGDTKAKSASIHWLGVIDKPIEGQAPIDKVEQAELTTQVGANPESSSRPSPESMPKRALPSEEPMPEEQVIEEQVVEESVPETREVEPVDEPVATPVEMPAVLPAEDKQDPGIVIEPEQVIEPEAKPESKPEQEPEPKPESESESVKEQPEQPKQPGQPGHEEQSQPVEDQSAESSAIEPMPESATPTPTPTGKQGIESTKESTASKIKRAIKVDGTKLHRPIVGKGLEIITVEPKFPATVRFTELPKNPVVLIRFNAKGRVKKVSFLRDGRKVYNTGARSVDEPLLSALYQWRAKGKEIDALDANDPNAYIEISMRITFRKDSSVP